MNYEKKYNELIEKLKKAKIEAGAYTFKSVIDKYISELKESEDEKIRKALINFLKSPFVNENITDEKVNPWIAWLEKQGEQKSIVEMKSPEESLGIDSDTYNKIVDECIYGEQKPADKVEPKFKVGQTIKKEGFNLGFPIVKIENGFYYNDMGDNFPFTDQDNWKLVEQKPADWSENDEEQLGRALYMMEQLDMTKSWDDVYNWLKSLRPQNRWKPSEGQLEALEKECIAHSNYELCRLLEQLKKLKE